MNKTVYLNTPLENKDIANLTVGDKVFISGVIYTGRDAAHKRIVDLLLAGKELPFPLEGQIIYYVGPAPAAPGQVIGSAGPTTSYRMDPYSPALLDAGLKGMIGKGQRSEAVKKSIKENKAIYLAAIGGAAVVMAQAVKKAEVIAYDDLGPEAVRRLEVENLPCIVANDIDGNDIYEEGVKQFKIEEN